MPCSKINVLRLQTPAAVVFGSDSLSSAVYVGHYTAISHPPVALYLGAYIMNCLVLWYIYALGYATWHSPVPLNPLPKSFSKSYNMWSPFTNQAIALPTSFSIFPSARTHSSSSQRFAMSDPGGHASHCTFLSLPAEIRRKIYKFVFEGNTVFVRPGKRITGTIKTTRSLEALYQLRYPRQFNCGVELGVHDVSGGAASMTESSASFARAARTGTSKASSFAGFGLRSFGGRV